MPMSSKVSSSLVLDESSFALNDFEAQAQKTTGGLIEFQHIGKFIHFNTIEEYNAFDFSNVQEDKDL